jgi:hypothetical protein
MRRQIKDGLVTTNGIGSVSGRIKTNFLHPGIHKHSHPFMSDS